MLGIPLGWAAANAAEWAIHKYVLHDRGRRKTSFWSFHWHEHHGLSRRNGFVDPHYERSVLAWNAQGKEALGLVGLGLAVAPLFPVAPFFVGTLWACGVHYHRTHKRAHLDPDWAREHLPWHYDHHMGPNPEANWCVTHPFFDHVMGTREPYLGTDRALRDAARRAERAARKATVSPA